MDRTQYTNLAKAWEFTEEHARELEPSTLADARTAADESGQLQGPAAQARLLGLLVRLTGASSVIAVGTGSLVETLQLAYALDNKGQLTAVDSTAQGITLIRKAFAELQDETATTLRAVNAPASVFLPRLNANDYDLIVVAGDAENYAATFAQASRLLRDHGAIVSLPSSRMRNLNPHLLRMVPDCSSHTRSNISWLPLTEGSKCPQTTILVATSTASSASSVTVTSLGSIFEIMPRSATGPSNQSNSPCQ